MAGADRSCGDHINIDRRLDLACGPAFRCRAPSSGLTVEPEWTICEFNVASYGPEQPVEHSPESGAGVAAARPSSAPCTLETTHLPLRFARNFAAPFGSRRYTDQ